MANASKYTKYNREAGGSPFVIKFDDEEAQDNIVIPRPSASVVMDAEESMTTRRFLRVIAGDEYDNLADFVDTLDAEGLLALVQDMAQHFGIAPSQVPEGKRR